MLTVEEPEKFYSRKENFPLRKETYEIIGLAMEVHKILGKIRLHLKKILT
jgi:hypothetical protein